MPKGSPKVILAILDGWGVAPRGKRNAISMVNTPTIESFERYYFALPLQSSGIAVGLPWEQAGNSETGHLNLGAGKIIYQYLPRIISAIRDGSFFKNKALKGATNFVKRNNSTLHLMGMFSSGNVHSYIDHLYALLDLAEKNSIENVVLHVFTDGKDAYEKEAASLIENLQLRLKKQGVGRIGTIMGRAYAMDRNNHWDLTQKAYNLLTEAEGHKIEDPVRYLEESYKKGMTDLDIEPAAIYKNNEPQGVIKEGDAVIFFNFREDSARQLTKAFVESDEKFAEFPREKISNLYFVGMTKYEEGLPIEVAFSPPEINSPLAKVISDAELKQLHIAESEKYAHTTYFFNGQKERPFPEEDRKLFTSRGTPNYDKHPEMQAYNITQHIFENIEKYNFIVANYANADLLAHTGNIEAVKKGVETIDANMTSLMELTQKYDNLYLCITSDHGNAEEVREKKTGRIKTKHSTNPVPFYLVHPDYKTTNRELLHQQKAKGVLADVAPTVLKLMGLQQPSEMTGKPLI